MLGQNVKSPHKQQQKQQQQHKNTNKVFPRRGLAYLDQSQAKSDPDEEDSDQEGGRHSLG
jgi:hypothetical protein